MIIQDRGANNQRGRFLVFSLTIIMALSLMISGCGNKDQSADSKSAPPSAEASIQTDQCGVTIDDTAWQAFAAIARAHQAGQTPERTDYQHYAELPIIAHWKESISGNISTVRIINWLNEAFTPTVDGSSKTNAERRKYRDGYAYTVEHLEDMDPLIAKFQSQGHSCNLMKKVNFWISEEAAPSSLVLAFLPSKPEIRVFHEYLFVDTGVLRAGNLEQLENQLASILFRARMSLNGDDPMVCESRDAVANSIRVMMNEGIIACIEDQASVIFAPDHPRLGKFNIVPEDIFERGSSAIRIFNNNIPSMLNDEKIMKKNGNDLARTLVAGGSMIQGGYSMSATIEGNLGKDALRATVGSPAKWLAAYQKAASMNPVPTPEPNEVMNNLYQSMPPLDPQVYDGLQEIIQQAFPTP